VRESYGKNCQSLMVFANSIESNVIPISIYKILKRSLSLTELKKRICIGYRYADASNNLYIKYADNKGEHSQCKELKQKEAVCIKYKM